MPIAPPSFDFLLVWAFTPPFPRLLLLLLLGLAFLEEENCLPPVVVFVVWGRGGG